MTIQTNNGNTYSFLHKTNQIVAGEVEYNGEWDYMPFSPFSKMPELYMFIIGITEQCNLRCTYCCYSGLYENNRSHSTKGLKTEDIDNIYTFIKSIVAKVPVLISFYGGEPLLQYPLIQYAIETGKSIFHDDVLFSITTNGTLLSPDKIDWLFENNVDINLSLDGSQPFHDKNRIYANGKGSYDDISHALEYINHHYPSHRKKISIQLTLKSYQDLEQIAEQWDSDPILHSYEPGNIHGLAPNFSLGVNTIEYENTKALYAHLLDVYEQHPDWAVLRTFFDESIAYWKTRPIMDMNCPIPLATCMPVNTKLYIDANKDIGVCEKMADKYRIGNIAQGIDWDKANLLAQEYYNRRKNRCQSCPIFNMCNMCLTSIEYSDEQWDILCHNERVYAQVFFWVFCEMAERGMIS